MNPKAMAPFGQALEAYQNGNTEADVIVRREDGVAAHLPIRHFFRERTAFSSIEREALDRCRGHVLDVGAGTGLHSLELQRRGLSVTAIDISPQAVQIMKQRGVKEAVCSDILSFTDGPFDTMLLMGHGIGMMETLAGLDRFFAHAQTLLSVEGQILLDSLDPSITDDPRNLAYHAANRRAGRYIGDVKICFEFQGTTGPLCGWLHVDPNLLRDNAARCGWSAHVIIRESHGEFLAQITSLATEEPHDE